MKTLTTLLLILIVIPSMAQSKYEKAMMQGMEMIQQDLLKAAGHFERVSQAEKDNWLPTYYAALAYTNSSWGQHPKEQTLNYMKKAQELIDEAEMRSESNPEIMVLQAMLNTCWITYDGAVYGMKLSAPTTAIYEKALAMAPENPRVVSNHAQWMMGSARYFGKDVTPYCGKLQKAVELFEQESQSGFEPSWGKERAVQALEQECKE